MRPRLLILDDEENLVFAMRSYFDCRGFDVDYALTAADAESLLTGGGYDLLITDVRLSGSDSRDGLDFAIDARRREPTLPIIVLTAGVTPCVLEDTRRIGANLLTKPVRLANVTRVADALIEHGGARSETVALKSRTEV